MLRVEGKYMTYGDGVASVYAVIDRRFHAAVPRQSKVHFKDKTVGERRYWDAYVNGVAIDRVAAVPMGTTVGTGDLFVTEGKQYVVMQVQEIHDSMPPSLLLSLQSATLEYKEA